MRPPIFSSWIEPTAKVLVTIAVILSSTAVRVQAAEVPEKIATESTTEVVRIPRGRNNSEYKTHYGNHRPVFGGPTSPEGEIEEFDRLKNPAFRFPKIDQFFKPWNQEKDVLNDKYGFQFSAHYSTMFQSLSESLSEDDKASVGVFRSTGKWTPQGRDSVDKGSLLVTIDHRHAFRDVAPGSWWGVMIPTTI